MATRIYRPDATRTWRETNAVSANATVSQWLAREQTDIKNRRLMSAVKKSERIMTLKSQRTEAWAKQYEVASRGTASFTADINQQTTNLNTRAATLNEMKERLDNMTAEVKAKQAAGTLTVNDIAVYNTQFNPLNEKYRQLYAVYGAQQDDYTSAQSQYDRQQADLHRLYGQYQHSTKVAKAAVNAYKARVRAYDRGYYPV